MSIAQALALIGSGAMAGSTEAEADRRRRQQEDEDRAWRNEERQQRRIDWQRANAKYEQEQADEQAARSAMETVTPDASPVAPPIGSRDVPRAPEDQGIRAGGRSFTDPAQAQAHADAMNPLQARMQRAAAAVKNPVLAAKFSQDAQQVETGAMQLAAAKRAEAAQVWAQQSVRAMQEGGPEGFAKFLSDSPADGEGGKVKVKAVMSSDGKKVSLHKVNPDGTSKAFSPEFDNNEIGHAQMVYQFDQLMTPEKKLAHLEGRADKERDFNLRKQDADSRAARENRMAAAAERQATAAESTAAVAWPKQMQARPG